LPIEDRWSVIGKLGATSNHPKFSGGSNLDLSVKYTY